jgi:ubiquinone/menaquinone biosynthesis C-methylase UbiE
MDNKLNYWDTTLESKNFNTPVDLEAILEYLPKDWRILDYGCGWGRISSALQINGYNNITGIDISEVLVNNGKKRFKNLDLRHFDGNGTGFDDESFDAVILVATLTAITENEAQIKTIREIFRILKPGGHLFVSDFLLNRDNRNLERYSQFAENYGIYGVFELPDGGIVRHHSEKWLELLFHNFHKMKFDITTFTTMNGNFSRGFHYTGKKV